MVIRACKLFGNYIYVAQSSNYGQSFTSTKMSAVSSNPGNATFTSDYIGITSRVGSEPLPVWTDFRSGSNADVYGALIGVPSAPTGLSLSGSAGDNHVVVSWTANSESDISSYEVWRYEHIDYYGTGELFYEWRAIGSSTGTSYKDNEWLYAPGGGDFTATYKIKAVDSGGLTSGFSNTVSTRTETPRNIAADNLQAHTLKELPEHLEVSPNYPNPFNPSTSLRVALPADAKVRLIIFDALGREVTRLADGMQEAGYHTYTWNAGTAASGLYFARLEVVDALGQKAFTKTTKLLLTK